MHPYRVPALILVTVATALCSSAALAQWSGSVNAMSEYRYRGAAFSEGKPSVQAGVAYDGDGGWYVGGFGARTRLAGRYGTHLVAYGGYARRLQDGLAWDAGISTSSFTRAEFGSYRELYAGLSSTGARGGMSARLSWSPRYYGDDTRTLYAEFDASTPLGERFDLFVHAGTLRTLSGPRPPQRSDVRAGVSARFGNVSAQLAYERGSRVAYRYGPDATSHALIASVGYGF